MQDREQQNPEIAEDSAPAELIATTAANDAASDTNFAADLEEQLTGALAEAAKLKDALLRAAADSDNMRKRSQIEVANAHKYALEGFAAELLPIKDSLEAALAVNNAGTDDYRNGVDLTLKQLAAALSKFKINEINPIGEKFDPHQHQAIAMVDADQEANTVVAVMQKGYTLHERVLRPALVTVAKAKTTP